MGERILNVKYWMSNIENIENPPFLAQTQYKKSVKWNQEQYKHPLAGNTHAERPWIATRGSGTLKSSCLMQNPPF